MNENLILVLEPAQRKWKKGHYNPPKARQRRGRAYYTVNRRCRLDEGHHPYSVEVYLDALGKDGLKAVFNDVSTHCLECGAEEYDQGQ